MQVVTVAIADTNPGRRAKLEQFLQAEPDIKVLKSAVPTENDISISPQLEPGTAVIAVDDVVAKVGQLKPRILFIHLDQSPGGDFALLEALHRQCPETRVLLLTDKSAQEEEIIQALANGARGCLSHETDPLYFSKAVRVVDRGEVWVTRKMLGKIMDKVLH
jgi:DNA-binding NarL/FixJ family response regulator